MSTLIVENRAGQRVSLPAQPSLTLMDIMRTNGVEDILALCGGTCSCATCHVIVEDEFAERVGPASEDEMDLLEYSDHRTSSSRLACQVVFSEELDGLCVRIAPED
ncbi:2Fe-2S iron-sulfur cluster-binding protein [Pseudomonas saliphila]|uniref:2Fe-2S iron-sulfur cluster-binding protein n=1 Tax=Pseudomonas saliphila TaxID=2586906 RepID=UPI00123A81E6|nr:2Fe-2S iron-sulfur cluster-binding protein [Pseudomonas saliphila]